MNKEQKRKKGTVKVILITFIGLVIFVVGGFLVGFFFFAPKLTGRNDLSLDIGLQGIRILDPENVKEAEDAGFADVWETGVSKNDIPSLKSNSSTKKSTSSSSSSNNSTGSDSSKNESSSMDTENETAENSGENTTNGDGHATTPSVETPTQDQGNSGYRTEGRRRDE